MKNILIIGGSKGIGKALVDISEESFVYNICRNFSEIKRDNYFEYNLDVTTDKLPQLTELDQIIYCPGSITLKPFEKLTETDFNDDYKINITGLIRVLQYYIPILKKGNHPAVIAYSSVASQQGMPFHSSIAMVKAAIEGLMKSLAAEYAPTIRFNTLALTLTDTPLASKILRNDKMYEAMETRHPLKKILNANEVATFTQSILNSHSISGQTIALDCGITTLKI